MKKDFLSKTLVMCTVLLFIGVGTQSAFAVEITEKEEIQPKDYLYETIIAISNNPDVQNLFEEHKNNIDFEFNNKYIFRQLLFRSPEIFWPMVFTKTKTTTQYLDVSYNQGIEIVNIFGEEMALDMLDSVEITYSQLLDDLNNIIENDEELSNRVSTLIELNNETSTLCKILFILGFRALIKWISLNWLERIFRNVPALELFFMIRSWLVIPQVFIISDLLKIFDCY